MACRRGRERRFRAIARLRSAAPLPDTGADQPPDRPNVDNARCRRTPRAMVRRAGAAAGRKLHRRRPSMAMNLAEGVAAAGSAADRAAPRVIDWPLAALAVSTLLHLLVLLALLLAPPQQRGGRRATPARTPIIFLAAEPRPAAPAAPPAPASTREEAQPLVPAAAAARAVPHKLAAPARPAPSTAPTVAAAPPLPQAQQEIEDVIGGIQANWLEPPGIRRDFRCRLRIDYLAGGIIAAMRFVSGCGSPVLDDSVRRAVWKTQPLPLRAPAAAGSLELDFTP